VRARKLLEKKIRRDGGGQARGLDMRAAAFSCPVLFCFVVRVRVRVQGKGSGVCVCGCVCVCVCVCLYLADCLGERLSDGVV